MPELWPWGVHVVYAFALFVVAVCVAVRFVRKRLPQRDQVPDVAATARWLAAWVVLSGAVSVAAAAGIYVLLCLWAVLTLPVEDVPWLGIVEVMLGEPFAGVLLAALLGGLLTMIGELRARAAR
jgi:predicted Co/Zn/Cd cation transporter (cation efflux family)